MVILRLRLRKSKSAYMLKLQDIRKAHISAKILRSDTHRTFGTPPLRCSDFNQTALFYESPRPIKNWGEKVGRTAGKVAEKFGISRGGLPQGGLINIWVFIKQSFMHGLYKLVARFCTHYVCGINSLTSPLVPLLHRTSNNYNKEES